MLSRYGSASSPRRSAQRGPDAEVLADSDVAQPRSARDLPVVSRQRRLSIKREAKGLSRALGPPALAGCPLATTPGGARYVDRESGQRDRVLVVPHP